MDQPVNRAFVRWPAVLALLALPACGPGLKVEPTGTGTATSSGQAGASTTTTAKRDPMRRILQTLTTLNSPLVVATLDGAGSFDGKVTPHPQVPDKSAFVAALCTGAPDVTISVDSQPVVTIGCSDTAGDPGTNVPMLAVYADPAVPHTLSVKAAAGQHTWLGFAYGHRR